MADGDGTHGRESVSSCVAIDQVTFLIVSTENSRQSFQGKVFPKLFYHGV